MKENLKTTRDETHKAESAADSPSKKRNLILLILLLLFFAFCAFAVIMRMRDPTATLWKLLRLQNISIIPKKDVIKTRTPKLLTDKTVTEKVTKDMGGTATITTPGGWTYRVSVGPGILSSDGTISLTPLEEPPFEWPSDPNGNNPPPDPGIDVVVDPPPPPQPPPDEPPINPDDPTETPPQPPPIVVVVIPPGRGGTLVPVEESNPDQIAADMLGELGLEHLITISPSVSPTPKFTEGKTSDMPTTFIFVPRNNGPVRIIPTTPVWADGSDTEGGDEADGQVPGEGTVTPENPEKDKGKADDAANQAGANGHCTDEYIFTYTQAYNAAQAAGDQAGMNRYGAALKDCAKDKLSYLKRLCETDRRLLRRKDFEEYRIALGALPDAKDVLLELTALENKCKGYYTIVGSGTPEATAGTSVVINSTIDSHVCGYFDDEWQGTASYTMNAEGGAGVHTYEGTHKFRLPSRGGQFGGMDTSGSHALTIVGVSVALPPIILGFGGTFDGLFTVKLVLYPKSKINVEIPLVSTDCSGENIPLPSLAPLSGDTPSSDIVPTLPLEPLPH